MTRSEFNSLQRGDILTLTGIPLAIVEAAYFQGGAFKIDATDLSGDTTQGITFSEEGSEDAGFIRQQPKADLPYTLGNQVHANQVPATLGDGTVCEEAEEKSDTTIVVVAFV